MIRQVLKSKIHRATVTEANVDYEGSITIDERLMVEAGLAEYEKVLVVNLKNGSRIETYVIRGAWASGVICANGGAALHNRVGDLVLIISFCSANDRELKKHKPVVVRVDRNNKPVT